MKTADGVVVKTLDGYPVVGKNPDDYNYPLYAEHPTQKTYTVVHSTQKTYTVVVDP